MVVTSSKFDVSVRGQPDPIPSPRFFVTTSRESGARSYFGRKVGTTLKNTRQESIDGLAFGGAEQDRTADLLNAIQALISPLNASFFRESDLSAHNCWGKSGFLKLGGLGSISDPSFSTLPTPVKRGSLGADTNRQA